MAIIKNYDLTSMAGKQAKWRDDEQMRINSQYQSLRSQFESMMHAFWRDDSPNGGLTVAQKCEALGTDAAQAFSIAGATAQMLVSIDPAYSPPTPDSLGYTYTINQDGSATAALKS